VSKKTGCGLVQEIYKTGAATEHSYRAAIATLIDSLDPGVKALNEPKRVDCGAPDFIVQRGEVPIGHIEAKDIGVSLSLMNRTNSEQKERYLQALPNLIYTNCLDWDFFRDGKLIRSITIGELEQGIRAHRNQFGTLENMLLEFVVQRPQTITSPQVLATLLAGKAVLIKDVLRQALVQDEIGETPLTGQLKAFRELLIHDITPEEFADIYAETLAYGMFAARLHDPSIDDFSRQEALELLPKSNPFLRSLFGYVAGPELDERIRWIVDDLASVLQAVNSKLLMAGFGKLTGRQDPFLHFYETFLAAYNPKKRKARGVWYTPEPVVNFIVRAVDSVLQKEFGLPDGIADTSKIIVDWDIGQRDKRGKVVTERMALHRVQLLDPACGTGTFLAEVIKQIAPKVEAVGEGMWSGYVENDLIPRVHGFELLMASYAMCHMKLDMVLTELAYRPSVKPPRLSVYLTNSLEEGERTTADLLMAQWLTLEARDASNIKLKKPIMCVIGNPPYSGESANKGDHIMKLMEVYKKEPGGLQKLQERNPKWINDDYVKFLRLAENMIEKNGEGVLGFITNHGYLDNPSFRGMRWHLLKTFDTLYVLDLHGNAKKKEMSPDGTPDKNVFDIQQGVAIIIGIKKRTASDEKTLATLFRADLWGDRATKYETLLAADLNGAMWQKVAPRQPQYSFTLCDCRLESNYQSGFAIDEFMPVNSIGIVTARDTLTLDVDRQKLRDRVQEFASLEPEQARAKYSLGQDVRDWRVSWAQEDVNSSTPSDAVIPISYRPFDNRWTFYTGKSRGFICYPRIEIMGNYLRGENVGLLVPKAMRDHQFAHAFVTKYISEAIFLSGTTASNAMNFPLYLYPPKEAPDQSRKVNFDSILFQRLQTLASDKDRGVPDELAVFDYIYGVLYRPSYRRTYADFLKNGFPRIPWPTSPAEFWAISDAGKQLRKLHLLEPEAVGVAPYPLRGEGTLVVDRVIRAPDGKVWISASQYFDSVPAEAWEAWIGGYQPVQKWLKDRRGHKLNFEEVKHYQQIIKVLMETNRIMHSLG